MIPTSEIHCWINLQNATLGRNMKLVDWEEEIRWRVQQSAHLIGYDAIDDACQQTMLEVFEEAGSSDIDERSVIRATRRVIQRMYRERTKRPDQRRLKKATMVDELILVDWMEHHLDPIEHLICSRVYAGMTYGEIAAEIGCKTTHVSNVVRRAQKKFNQYVEVD